MTKRKILIVDDELSVRQSLEGWFLEDGFSVATAEDGNAALRKMETGPFDIVIVDLKMPGMDGIELQKRVRQIDPDAAIVILTAFASVETAVEALKLGAYDYVTKPVDPDDLSHLVGHILKQKELTEANVRLRELTAIGQTAPMLGESPKMKQVFSLIDSVAKTDSTVVIRGESGTGKELIARAIHERSQRRFFPIIAVNSGSLPETLLESELFGHEKGAFTGAQYRRKGKLELADGGTLFLDEIGDISSKMQIDLLRVLESRQFTRVGGNQEIASDFRLVCATNKRLEQLVEQGAFREDLYYRINVFGIEVPPLRERREDLRLLAEFFVEKSARAMGRPAKQISPEAMEMLERYRWPGNVRELENAIERAMVIGKEETIVPDDLPLQVEEKVVPVETSLAAMEKDHIERVLEETDGNMTRSARILGIDRATLYNKVKRYGIRR